MAETPAAEIDMMAASDIQFTENDGEMSSLNGSRVIGLEGALKSQAKDSGLNAPQGPSLVLNSANLANLGSV